MHSPPLFCVIAFAQWHRRPCHRQALACGFWDGPSFAVVAKRGLLAVSNTAQPPFTVIPSESGAPFARDDEESALALLLSGDGTASAANFRCGFLTEIRIIDSCAY